MSDPHMLEIEDLRTENERLGELLFQEIYRGQEKLDEIERLRAIIQDIANAVTDEGIKPGYHKQQVNYVRTMWNPLWQAIGKAVKEMGNGTGKP
jgi:demethoxyubiquinone hydroxylase (CLK1/Coq7/Cat5 family)